MKLTRSQHDRVKKGKCKHEGCKNKPGKKRLECHRHRGLGYQERHPIRRAYYVWKWNCVRRGKPFNVTFEEFSAFNVRTSYIERSGRGANDMSIDRKRNNEGYHIDNMQPLSVSDNASKGTKEWVPLPELPGGRAPF